ncbi:MAG TPA: hypothetical protein VGI81_24000 [Tepidisphaeraceae bacterium]|jgi:hypothetical protein
MMKYGILFVLAVGSLCKAAALGLDVVSYSPGDANPTFQNPNAALGALNGDTTFGGLNPFNPAFDPSQIVIVGGGGDLQIHLSSAVSTAGRNLGVYTANGIVDVSSDGSGQAGNPATLFSPPSQAVISVSKDGNQWFALNGGAPVTLDSPTNYYLDSEISGYYQPLGTQTADPFKPWSGSLKDLNGLSYDQIKAAFAGSAGGNWLDLSGAGTDAINYVDFSVPSGDRLVLDSVAGAERSTPVPEPVTLGYVIVALPFMLLYRRRRSHEEIV